MSSHLRRVNVEEDIVEEPPRGISRMGRARRVVRRVTPSHDSATIIVIIVVVIILLILLFVGLFLLWWFLLRKRRGGAGCDSNANCAKGFVCSNGKCKLAAGGTCSVDTDCAAGEICSSGICKGMGGVPCTSNSQCASGFFCSNGKCEGSENAVCKTSNDCLDPFICTNGKCSYVSCTTSSDCASDQFCSPNGKCVLNFDQSCSSDAQCNGNDPGLGVVCSNTHHKCGFIGGQFCLSIEPSMCSSGVCKETAFPTGICTCADNKDCPSGFTCSNGTCV